VTIDRVLQGFINFLLLGSIYAVLAIGYSLVYGVLRFINFAHGVVFMIGAYIPHYAQLLLSLPWPAAFVLAIGLSALLGVTIERIGYRPLREAPKTSTYLSGIGITFFLENFAVLAFSGRPKAFPRAEIFTQSYRLGPLYLSSITIYTIAVVVVSLVALYYLIYRTKIGLSIRAIAEDHQVASLMGIPPNHVISVTFAIGSALAAVGAIAWSLRFPVLTPTMGNIPATKAFIATVVGGVGNIGGAIVGGLLIGFAEVFIVLLLPSFMAYKDIFAFVLLMIILIARPQGILGTTVLEQKV